MHNNFIFNSFVDNQNETHLSLVCEKQIHMSTFLLCFLRFL